MFYDSRQLGKKKDWGPFTRMPRATASSWRNYSHILFSSLNFLYFPDFLQPSCMCFINTRDDKSTWCSTDPSRASICFLLYWNQMGWLPSPSSFLLHVGMNLCSPCGRGGGVRIRLGKVMGTACVLGTVTFTIFPGGHLSPLLSGLLVKDAPFPASKSGLRKQSASHSH